MERFNLLSDEYDLSQSIDSLGKSVEKENKNNVDIIYSLYPFSYEIPFKFNNIFEKQEDSFGNIIKDKYKDKNNNNNSSSPPIQIFLEDNDNSGSTFLKSTNIFKTKNIFNFFKDNAIPKLENINEKNDREERKKVSIGRKRNNCIRLNISHNKESDDNLVRKIKHILIDALLKFLNYHLKIDYINSVKTDFDKKEFLKMDQSQIVSSKADYNRYFLRKKIKDIFSHNISTKFKNYSPYHNINLINYLLNENNIYIKEKYRKIFNLTFLDCLEHFIGTKTIEELEGMVTFEQLYNTLLKSESPEYVKKLKYYLINFQKIIEIKKTRNRSKKSEKLKNNI